MSQTFLVRLKKYYSDIGKVLRGEAGAASVFPNATDIGSSREQLYATVLRLHLPSICNVSFGGFLFDQQGRESKQIDILITNDAALRFNFLNKDGIGKSFACVDGCIGIVSVKSTLDATALHDALRNIASIPDKQPLTADRIIPGVQIPNYNEWPFKIIYASDGTTLENAVRALGQFYAANPHIPEHKKPNLIHVAGKYAITRSVDMGDQTRDGTPIPPNTFVGESDESDVIGLFRAINKIQLIALSSKYVIFTYADLLNNIPLS